MLKGKGSELQRQKFIQQQRQHQRHTDHPMRCHCFGTDAVNPDALVHSRHCFWTIVRLQMRVIILLMEYEFGSTGYEDYVLCNSGRSRRV